MKKPKIISFTDPNAGYIKLPDNWELRTDLINYKVGDLVQSKTHSGKDSRALGVCTKIDGGCIWINNSNHGGAAYFEKCNEDVDLKQFEDEAEKGLKYQEWSKTHDIWNDKIEITPAILIEIQRAFKALGKDKGSYLHKVFSDDYSISAINKLKNIYDNYFNP